jgi:AbrB family looped-hinge helix DNA binding protein
METVKLSTKGQIVIPKGIRDIHHLSPGTEFAISFVGEEIRLKPLPAFPPASVADGLGFLAKAGQPSLSESETEAAITAQLLADDEATKG